MFHTFVQSMRVMWLRNSTTMSQCMELQQDVVKTQLPILSTLLAKHEIQMTEFSKVRYSLSFLFVLFDLFCQS